MVMMMINGDGIDDNFDYDEDNDDIDAMAMRTM